MVPLTTTMTTTMTITMTMKILLIEIMITATTIVIMLTKQQQKTKTSMVTRTVTTKLEPTLKPTTSLNNSSPATHILRGQPVPKPHPREPTQRGKTGPGAVGEWRVHVAGWWHGFGVRSNESPPVTSALNLAWLMTRRLCFYRAPMPAAGDRVWPVTPSILLV